MMFPNWNWSLIAFAAISVSFHSVAILSTLFRLWYRWYIARMWWDDAWATLALLADTAFLIASVLEQPVPDGDLPRFFSVGNWIVSFAYPVLMWSARISILTSMKRISRPDGMLKHTALGIGIFFGMTGIAMLVLRARLCIVNACLMTKTVLIAQTTTDCLADVLLSALPIWFLRDVTLSRKRRVLISCVLSASMVINIVTITEAVAVFRLMMSGSIIFEHVKVACSMMVCNLLVIATFVYRIMHKNKQGLDHLMSEIDGIEFTTVDLTQWANSQGTNTGRSLPTSSEVTKSKSSTWSFPYSQSKASRPVAGVASRIRADWEEEHQ